MRELIKAPAAEPAISDDRHACTVPQTAEMLGLSNMYVTSSASMESLMTTEQLAEFLKVPLATLYQWRHKGTGPKGIKVGKHVRYRRGDVEAWLEKQAAT